MFLEDRLRRPCDFNFDVHPLEFGLYLQILER